MTLKIFSCHHVVTSHELSTAIYQSLVSGREVPADSQTWTDIAGENISTREKFSELRHQFYVWKNLLNDYDYVGFEHYRRLFCLDPRPINTALPISPEMATSRARFALAGSAMDLETDSAKLFQDVIRTRRHFTDADHEKISAYIKDHDILFAKPIMQPARDNFVGSHSHSLELWDEIMPAFKQSWHKIFPTSFVEPPAAWSGYLNMYIMRTEFFYEYMSWIMPVLLELDDHYPAAAARVWGHVAERLLGAYIVQKTMERPSFRFKALPHFTFGRAACA